MSNDEGMPKHECQIKCRNTRLAVSDFGHSVFFRHSPATCRLRHNAHDRIAFGDEQREGFDSEDRENEGGPAAMTITTLAPEEGSSTVNYATSKAPGKEK